TVPGSAQASMTATSSSPRPRKFSRRTAYATSTPNTTQPTVAMRLICSELRIGSKASGSEKMVTKFFVVYAAGTTSVVQEPSWEKATRAMVATGASSTAVASSEATSANQRPSGLVTSRRCAATPLDWDR